MAKILYFGPLADLLQKESEQFPLPTDMGRLQNYSFTCINVAMTGRYISLKIKFR